MPSSTSNPNPKPTNTFISGLTPELLEEMLAAFGRIVFIAVLCITISFFGMIWFPAPLPRNGQPFLDWNNMLRFLIVPLGAVVWVILTGARFLQNVYGLEDYKPAIKYILSSMFLIGPPHLTIDGGKVKIKENEINPILVFGGPGTVTVQPGNAVMFRHLQRRSRHGITSSVFLQRFETLGMIADLADQEDVIDELTVVTRDGIKVMVKGAKYHYRVISNQPKHPDNPYPFLDAELDKMAYNSAVREDGQPTWRSTIKQAVANYIKEFLSDYSIDDLTAPRTDAHSPWREIHQRLTNPALTPTISSVGAKLIWFDLGHFQIDAEIIDESRVGSWAADWVGNAEIKKAYASGTRIAYQEQAWAEAQAEIIKSITRGLDGINLNKNSTEDIRKMFLEKTNQLIKNNNLESDEWVREDDLGLDQ